MAMLPAQSSSAPSGSRRLGQLGGKVGVLDHLGTAVDDHDHAQLLVGREPLDDLERHLRLGLRCRPMNAGSAIWTSGLSTWK